MGGILEPDVLVLAVALALWRPRRRTAATTAPLPSPDAVTDPLGRLS